MVAFCYYAVIASKPFCKWMAFTYYKMFWDILTAKSDGALTLIHSINTFERFSLMEMRRNIPSKVVDGIELIWLRRLEVHFFHCTLSRAAHWFDENFKNPHEKTVLVIQNLSFLLKSVGFWEGKKFSLHFEKFLTENLFLTASVGECFIRISVEFVTKM